MTHAVYWHPLVFFPILALSMMIGIGLLNPLKSLSSGEDPESGQFQGNLLKRSLKQELSKGKYYGQDWHITRGHLLWWDGKPYIPFSLNEIRLEKEIKQLLKDIDFMIERGITDFSFGYNTDTPMTERNAYDHKIRTMVDYLEKKKVNYLFYFTPAFAIEKFSGNRTCKFLLRPPVQEAVAKDLQRFGPLVSRPGLRAVLFMEEINGNEGIQDSIENIYHYLPLLLDTYGRKVKESIGDVPVIMSITSDNIFFPFLNALQGNSFDGVVVQIHGAIPRAVEFKARRVLPKALSVLNALPKTKLLWGYSQIYIMEDFVLFRSSPVMKEHYLSLSKYGVTGIKMDQQSSFGFVNLGLKKDSDELRRANIKWFGENKEVVINDILERSKRREFESPQEMAVFYPPVKKPKMASSQVFQIAEKYFDLKQKGSAKKSNAKIHKPYFDYEKGYWTVRFGSHPEFPSFIIIEDNNGEMIFDGVDLLEEVHGYYPEVPKDEGILLKSPIFYRNPGKYMERGGDKGER